MILLLTLSVKTKSLLYVIALAIMPFYLTVVGAYRWGDDSPPRITLATPFTLVGPATPLTLRVEDEETGLRSLTVHLAQNLERYTLADERFPSQGLLSLAGGTRHTFDLTMIPYGDDAVPKRRGPAKLIVSARDHSWRGLFEGNQSTIEQDVTVKFTPPTLDVVSRPLPVSQGGTGVVFYRVSEDTKRSGVRVGDAFFPGYRRHEEAFRAFSLFAFPHDAPTSTPILLVADDGLGNQSERRVHVQIIPRQWRTRNVTVTDRFIEQTVRPIIARTPDLDERTDPLQNFLQVNHVLRRRNADHLKALALDSRPEFTWKGAFVQLSRSQVNAAFADRRHYVYHGKVVDVQDHLGFDLAVTAHYPVEAANDGRVVLAEDFGIYGNAVVIDHGYGLQSLYAHLSSIDAQQGEDVTKGHVIGQSGMTGLAAGDHLHFSLLLHGVQVNPLEWWDPQWVQTHVSHRLRKDEAVESSSPLPDQMGPAPFPEAPPPTL